MRSILCVYIYVSWRLVKYSRIMLPTPPTDINAQWNYLSKIIQDIHDKLGVQSTSSKSHEIIFSPYWHFLLIAQVLHKVLVLLFHTEGLMCYIKSLTHDCPQKQWNILELKVPLPVLSSRPQQPCRSVWALWLQNAVRNFNLVVLFTRKDFQHHEPCCFKHT